MQIANGKADAIRGPAVPPPERSRLAPRAISEPWPLCTLSRAVGRTSQEPVGPIERGVEDDVSESFDVA